MLEIALALVVAAQTAPASRPAADALVRADGLYARRAEGAHGGVANPEGVDAAIAAYRRALALDPSLLEARVGLLRALYFRGGFCDTPPAEQVRIFEEAKRLAEESVARLEKDLGSPRGAAKIQALRGIPAAPGIYFWAAVSWGQWSVDHKIAAAWQGAAVRIRDLAQTVVDLDPTMDQGSAYLILGRLHAECPKIPMLTAWISRQKALSNLRQAMAVGPANSPNMYFLADAILTFESAHEDEARRLLDRCASATPRPEYLVEDAHYAQMARQRLAGLDQTAGGTEGAPKPTSSPKRHRPRSEHTVGAVRVASIGDVSADPPGGARRAPASPRR
jgi:tetratricopeptide (TPR) repeat protein